MLHKRLRLLRAPPRSQSGSHEHTLAVPRQVRPVPVRQAPHAQRFFEPEHAPRTGIKSSCDHDNAIISEETPGVERCIELGRQQQAVVASKRSSVDRATCQGLDVAGTKQLDHREARNGASVLPKKSTSP